MIDLTRVTPAHEADCICHVCAAVLAHTFNVRQMSRHAHGESAGAAMLEIGRRMRWVRALREEHNLTTGADAE